MQKLIKVNKIAFENKINLIKLIQWIPPLSHPEAPGNNILANNCRPKSNNGPWSTNTKPFNMNDSKKDKDYWPTKKNKNSSKFLFYQL